MASGKVARRAVVGEIAALLDSPEVAALIVELDALRWRGRGRKGHGTRALVGACLIKALYGLPTGRGLPRSSRIIRACKALSEAVRACGPATASRSGCGGTPKPSR